LLGSKQLDDICAPEKSDQTLLENAMEKTEHVSTLLSPDPKDRNRHIVPNVNNLSKQVEPSSNVQLQYLPAVTAF
jgi:hypothetical protein